MGDEEDAVRRNEFRGIGGSGLAGVEAGLETVSELGEVLLNTPARIVARRVDAVDRRSYKPRAWGQVTSRCVLPGFHLSTGGASYD